MVGAKGHACLGAKPNPEYSFDLRGLSSLHYLFVVTAAVFNHAKYMERKLASGALQQKPLLPSEPGTIVLPAPHLAGVTAALGYATDTHVLGKKMTFGKARLEMARL